MSAINPDSSTPHSPDRHIHTVVQGTGPSLVLLHGLTGSSLNWNRLGHALKEQHQTVAFDFIGHARSSAPLDSESYQIKAILNDIDQQVEQHGQKGPDGKPQATLCGLSMGAAAMLLYTLQHPEKVKGLILTSFPPAKEHPGSISAIANRFADAILNEGLEQAGERFVWGPDSPYGEHEANLIKQGFMMHKHPHGLAYCMKEFLAKIPDQESLLEQVKTLDTPTLLIAGSRDPGSLHYSQALSSALPTQSHQLTIIEKGGHLVNIDSVQRYNAAVSQFLNQLGESSL